MSAPYAGGSPTEGQEGYWRDPQQTPGDQYLPPQNRDPRTAMNAPGDYSSSPADPRQFQNTTPRGSSDRDQPPRQSYQNANNQLSDRYNQENGSLSNLRTSSDANSQGQSGSRRPSGPRICAKCNLPLSGQFVRALDNTYHLECFTCQVSSFASWPL